jgi:formamidopyrimidine-DNA glycosylase
MPELPEVEAARRILEEHCVGREITLVDAAADESELNSAFNHFAAVSCCHDLNETGVRRQGVYCMCGSDAAVDAGQPSSQSCVVQHCAMSP